MNINFNFPTFGFGEIFKQSENVDSSLGTKDSIVAVADTLSKFSIPRGAPVEFKSISSFLGLDYVGYVIEKERYDPTKQQWHKTDELRLIGSKSNVFRDSRIAYGYTYRYRMKSVVKITVKRPKSFLSSVGLDIKEYEYISTYYESNPGEWIIIDAVKNEPPVYPSNIKIFPNSNKKEIMISWLKPVSAAEVKFFNIYRRNQVGRTWEKIAEGLTETETMFIDTNIGFDNKYIYAITSIDVHGIESYLSTQIQVELNSNIAIEKKEKDLVWISGGGTKPDEIETILKKFYERKETLIAKKSIILKPNTKFREESRDLLIRITSLDTHEKKELALTLQNVKLQK